MTPEQKTELRKALSREKEIYETYLLGVNRRIEEIDKDEMQVQDEM